MKMTYEQFLQYRKVDMMKTEARKACGIIVVDFKHLAFRYGQRGDEYLPEDEAIKTINERTRYNFIVVSMEQTDGDAIKVLDWLDRHNVRYHANIFGFDFGPITPQIEYMKNHNTVVAFDMDGILCVNEEWGEGYPNPIEENIELVNRSRSDGNYIVIHTARRRELLPLTLEWLNTHHVKFDAIRFDKMPADMYVDDKSFNPVLEALRKEHGPIVA